VGGVTLERFPWLGARKVLRFLALLFVSGHHHHGGEQFQGPTFGHFHIDDPQLEVTRRRQCGQRRWLRFGPSYVASRRWQIACLGSADNRFRDAVVIVDYAEGAQRATVENEDWSTGTRECWIRADAATPWLLGQQWKQGTICWRMVNGVHIRGPETGAANVVESASRRKYVEWKKYRL
jgi:hypothetical protein